MINKHIYVMRTYFIIISMLIVSWEGFAQKKEKDVFTGKDSLSLTGLSFRALGPALTSGRIADFAVHPSQSSTYYVATASGGVWKTTNAGTTYEPIFDQQGSYSIGCVSIDPKNPQIVWVGTGENNNQRSVAYGDGVYKSEDGGKTWKNVGLKTSEHIGKIIVDPRDSKVVYVAAIGPLWSSGDERGLYKTTDGGKSWEAVLTISKYTGVNDVIMDPGNPDILYASAFQRRRHVFTWIGGGPESSLYKSKDAGKTWEKITQGLPKVDLGRIGLAISPADPSILYALVNAAKGEGGFFRSLNGGESWEKQSGHTTSGNYYAEIVCDPKDPNKVFSMNTWLKVTKDGGKTFESVNEQFKHVDNHCMWINPHNTDHYITGCDGGIYESFDGAKTWSFKANLPVTQFYKVAVDNATPFYNIYGGTQDNFSLGGPSRTVSENGIVNSDWVITLGGDGFESQVDTKDPNIVYAQYQYGNLFRFDKKSGEKIGIKPRERKGENEYRWNWDAPLLVSNHLNTRLYFAANKLFKSNDRGNSWEVISEDLTRQIDRNTLKVMDRIWEVDALDKHSATSPYGTIVALDESPLDENLLYVGTDDGLIQVTEDGGKTWTKIENITGVPTRTYVNALIASQHSKDVVYAVLNNHKNGDFKPYIYKSTDRGKNWRSITGNLPVRGSGYCIAEDHIDANLLFVGTEFGVFFTNDAGKVWTSLKNGLPTIAVRDIAIQQRENDLVLGTFGRGFYVLDDYSPLRQLNQEVLTKDAYIFPIKDAFTFIESTPLGVRGKGFQGDNYYYAKNPRVGAVFTYYISEGVKTQKETRQEADKKAKDSQQDAQIPSYEKFKMEQEEQSPYLLFVIKDEDDNIVRKLQAPIQEGVHRVVWDFRYPSTSPIRLTQNEMNPFESSDLGRLSLPGTYTVTLYQSVNDVLKMIYPKEKFQTVPLQNTTLPAKDKKALAAFQAEVRELQRVVQGANHTITELENKLKYMRKAVYQTDLPSSDLIKNIQNVEGSIRNLKVKLYGDPIVVKLDQSTPPPIVSRINNIVYEQWTSTSAPTHTQEEGLKIAKEEFSPVWLELKKITTQDMKNIEEKLEKAGAPYTPGRLLDWSVD